MTSIIIVITFSVVKYKLKKRRSVLDTLVRKKEKKKVFFSSKLWITRKAEKGPIITNKYRIVLSPGNRHGALPIHKIASPKTELWQVAAIIVTITSSSYINMILVHLREDPGLVRNN